MFTALSFLLRKSHRRILTVAGKLLRKGYGAAEIVSLLEVSGDRALKASDLRRLSKLSKQIEKNGVAGSGLRKPIALPGEQSQGSESERHTFYTQPANRFIDQLDFSDKHVLELCTGRSTPFWCGRAKSLVTVARKQEQMEKILAFRFPHVTCSLHGEKGGLLQHLSSMDQVFDVIILSDLEAVEWGAGALNQLADTGMIILDTSDWFPGTSALFRDAKLLEVDMEGFGPGRKHAWTTSFFLRRNASFVPAHARQPHPSQDSNLIILDATAIPTEAKPSLNNLDEKLAPYLNFRNGLFIEAGANDGYKQSNTYFLENSLGWKGVLVEAVPDLASKACKNRARSRVFNCALVTDEEATPTVIIHYCDLMSIIEGGFHNREKIDEQLRTGLAVQSIPESVDIEVPARTLTSVLDEYNPGRQIDFFSLDVEGYEMQVLEGLDFARYSPRLILVETAHLEVISSFLGSRGYKLEATLTVHDYLFKLAEQTGPGAKAGHLDPP